MNYAMNYAMHYAMHNAMQVHYKMYVNWSRTNTWGVRKAGLKTGIVYKSVGYEEEVGNDGCDGVEFCDADEGTGDQKRQSVRSPRLVVRAVTFRKPSNIREQLVFTHSLDSILSELKT
jgi:hypothetical protein